MKHLTSQNNTELKRLRLLFQKAKERKKQGVFVIEGIREIEKAILGDYKINAFFVEEGCESVYSKILNKSKEVLSFSVKKSVFEITSMRSGSEKIIAIVKSKTHTLDRLNLTDNGIILVVEAPEKPGNIGALYRTAAAAKIDSIIIANPKTDFYNPNVVRASIGHMFTLNLLSDSTENIIKLLKKHNYQIILMDPIHGQSGHERISVVLRHRCAVCALARNRLKRL